MEYFAALPSEQLAAEMLGRIDKYYNWILTTNRLKRWRTAYNTYYGQRSTHSSSEIRAAGDGGELSFLMSNEYRNLVQHLLVLAFEQRPSLETVAINTDARSKADTYVAKGLIEYFRRDGKIDDNSRAATEISLIMDTGWVINLWDVMKGQDVAADPDTGKLVRQGDISSRARTPLEVVVDITKPQGADNDWICFKDPVNKFDLAAQYSERAEEISGLQRDLHRDALFRFGDVYEFDSNATDSPDIDVWTFVHRRSPALPQGRLFQFASPTAFFFDGPTPYRKLPGNRVCPSEQILSPLGYSNCNDLISLQDVIDALVSSAVTNMTATAANVIWTKPNPNFDFQQLAKGMSLIEGDEKPETLMLNRLAPEWFNLANFIIQRMESLSGVNSVARGNTGGKDLSGAAMALLQSMAIQFNSGLMRSVNRLHEENGNDIIQLTQDFAKEKRMGMIIGHNNEYMMQEYSAKDVSSIQRVYCRQSNPMKDTTAGKMQLLDKYIEIGSVTTAEDITEVMDTGQLSSKTEGGRNLKLAIDQENEALMRGEVPPVIFTDNHPKHMQEHANLLASPQARKDALFVGNVRKHFEQHSMQWATTRPEILAALAIPPFPGQMPLPGGPGGAPAGPGASPPPPGAPSPSGPPGGAPPDSGAVVPGGPSMPQNPLTNEAFNPQGNPTNA